MNCIVTVLVVIAVCFERVLDEGGNISDRDGDLELSVAVAGNLQVALDMERVRERESLGTEQDDPADTNTSQS